jgi:uncharacterized protein involved in exopolysaccharide biosynthesis
LEHTLDKTKPPSTSYRETFRRHRKLFSIPVILGALVAALFLFISGQSYKATASLWVDTPAPTPSSIGAGSSALVEPPASAEQGILSELLTTSSFTSSVAENSLLGKSVGSAASIPKNATALLGTGQVVPTVEGNQVLQISYSAPSPAIAKSVLAAVVAQLRNYTDRLASQHERAAVASATGQGNAAETAPAIAGRKNPGGWSIQVIDPPTNAGSAALGKKKIVEIILGGAVGGLLVSFLAVVALTPTKKEAWEDELPIAKGSLSDVPSGDSVRAKSPAAPNGVAHTSPVPTAVDQLRLSMGERRFSFRSPSAPVDEQ